MLRLAAAAALLALCSAQPLPKPPLPPLPDTVTSSVSSLAAAMQEPGRLADAYASARNAAAAQQWADATKAKPAASAPVVLPPAAAAGKPLVAATAQAQTGSPNPTSKTVVVGDGDGGLPADPVEAVVQAGADAVSGRPPRLVELLAGPEVGAAEGRARVTGGAGRRMLQAAGADDSDADTATTAPTAGPAKPTMSKYKLFKTADPHRGVAAGIASILPPHLALPALPGR